MEGRGRRQRGRKVVGLQAIVYHLFGSNWGDGHTRFIMKVTVCTHFKPPAGTRKRHA